MENRDCNSCKGTGVRKGFTSEFSGQVFPDTPCRFCEGSGKFAAPDVAKIVRATLGRKPRTLRSAAPKNNDRAYFVWRMARFHGGADVRMPIVAEAITDSDPYKEDLDKISEGLAKVIYGTDLAATRRWGQAVYGEDRIEGARCSRLTPLDYQIADIVDPSAKDRRDERTKHFANFVRAIANVGQFLTEQTCFAFAC